MRCLLAVVGVALVGVCGSQAATPLIDAEALLAAGVPWTTVKQVAGPDWWPQLPQFEAPPLFRQPLPKRPVTVTSQWYVRPGADAAIQTTLYAFKGSAEPGICPFLAETDGVSVNGRVPAVGLNHSFWTPGDPSSPVTVFCFERGPVAVVIKVLGETWRAEKMGRLARPVDDNVKALLAGTLPYGVGNGTLGVLPTAADAPGRVLGTAALLPEAWASNASDPTPQQLLGRLRRGGVATLPFRRYLLGDGTNVVEVTLFAFRTDAAATGWLATLAHASSTLSTELPPAATGKQSLFRQLDEYYVLDFVAGRAVGDITCYAPYGEKPAPACIAVLRKLGERWYAQLSRR